MSPATVSVAYEEEIPPLLLPAHERPAVASKGAALAASADDPGKAMRGLFGVRVINDGTGMIKLATPSTVQSSAEVLVSVEVNWWLVLAKAVAHLYLVADGNAQTLLARVALLPDVVPPHLCFKIPLDRSTHVRAVVECGDGTLLQVSRWIKVAPPVVRDQGIRSRGIAAVEQAKPGTARTAA